MNVLKKFQGVSCSMDESRRGWKYDRLDEEPHLKVFFNYPQKCYEELYSKEYVEELRCTLNKISVREKVMQER